MEDFHRTVFLNEVLEYLDVKKDHWYLDSTLGDGGHSLEILERGGKVLGIDVDPEAITRAKSRFNSLGFTEENFRIVNGNFSNLESLVDKTDPELKFSGIIFDLGVSTLQLKTPERGFSIYDDGPLDMRMDPNLAVKAMDLVNALNKGEIERLFLEYGEESWAKRIASEIVAKRPFQTTRELAELIEKIIGKDSHKIHPATKAFQALRIAVNDELGVLREVLPQAFRKLTDGGRLLIISFHSLEDRIVKEVFRDWEEKGLGKELTNKPLKPTEDEVARNPRSRSAILRIFEKNV